MPTALKNKTLHQRVKAQQEIHEKQLLNLELLSRIAEVSLHVLQAHTELMQGMLENFPLVVNLISGLGEAAIAVSEAISKDSLSRDDKIKIGARFLTGSAMVTTAIVGLCCPPVALSMAAIGTGIAFAKSIANTCDFHHKTHKLIRSASKEEKSNLLTKQKIQTHKKELCSKKTKLFLGAVTLGCMIAIAANPITTPVLATAIAASCIASIIIGKKTKITKNKTAPLSLLFPSMKNLERHHRNLKQTACLSQ